MVAESLKEDERRREREKDLFARDYSGLMSSTRSTTTRLKFIEAKPCIFSFFDSPLLIVRNVNFIMAKMKKKYF